jgi:hypothetical protein
LAFLINDHLAQKVKERGGEFPIVLKIRLLERGTRTPSQPVFG